MKLDWLGLAGWRWVFILEGIPARLFGFITLFAMTDRPEQATWLDPEERSWLLADLESEKEAKAAHTKVTAWQALRQPTVLLLALILFFANIGTVTFILWVPTIIQKAASLSPSSAAVLSGLPFAVAVVSVLVWSRSSDRSNKRVLHTYLPLFLSSLVFPLTAIPNQPLFLLLAGLLHVQR